MIQEERAVLIDSTQLRPQRAKARGLLAITRQQLCRSKTGMVGLTIVLLLVAAVADVVAPYNPTAPSRESIGFPSWEHPMGTDLLGRDVLSRIIYDSRVSVYVGVVSILLAIFVWIPLGTVAGFYGGWLDNLIMRIMDVYVVWETTRLNK